MKLYTLIAVLLAPAVSAADCLRECAAWDTFCKSPQQVVATKCRLGVPVYREECDALGIPAFYQIRGGGQLVRGLPCSAAQNNTNNEERH